MTSGWLVLPSKRSYTLLYSASADFKKMYRKVKVNVAHRQFQLINWRKDSSEPLRIFALNTVTYGTAPAPFLAIRCLKKLSETAQVSHPKAANVIRTDFYIDDLLTGAAWVEELETIKSDLSKVLQEVGLELAKWFSSSPEISASENTVKPITISDSKKTLVIVWLPHEDVFKLKLDESRIKRNILSVTSKLFDPLGLPSPLIIKGRILLQELWLLKLD